MENLKELERRIRVALDRISIGTENYSHSYDASATEEALQAEINVLSEQNSRLSALMVNLEQERKAETEELQALYEKLAEVLNASDKPLEEEA